jgi:Mrp family chromosome partitioning ATPase
MTLPQRKPSPFQTAQKKFRTLTDPLLDRAIPSILALPLKSQQRRRRQATAKKGEDGDMPLGDPASAARLAKVISLADSQSARIIGLTGARGGVGVSTVARQLAAALGDFGRQTLLVDASRCNFSYAEEPRKPEPEIDLLALASEIGSEVGFIDLAHDPAWMAKTFGALRGSFEKATRKGKTMVVVDLPPVVLASGHPSPALATAGAACDLVFLVCLSGRTKRRELTSSVDTCGIAGVKLGGLILNDWRLPASGLLE